jgi:hypothetical protein
MKSRLRALVAAEGVAIDQLTGRVTAFNAIDAIAIVEVPTLFLRLVVIAAYELGDEPELLSERVSFVSPAGQRLVETVSSLDLHTHPPNGLPNAHRSIHTLWRLPLQTDGDYRVLLEHKVGDEWVEVSSLCVTVVVQARGGFQTPSLRPVAGDDLPE